MMNDRMQYRKDVEQRIMTKKSINIPYLSELFVATRARKTKITVLRKITMYSVPINDNENDLIS